MLNEQQNKEKLCIRQNDEVLDKKQSIKITFSGPMVITQQEFLFHCTAGENIN